MQEDPALSVTAIAAPKTVLMLGWPGNTARLWVTVALAVGMAPGALTAGLRANRWFSKKCFRVTLFCLTGAALTSLLLAGVSASKSATGTVLLAVTGFLVFGPQSAYWALFSEPIGRERLRIARLAGAITILPVKK